MRGGVDLHRYHNVNDLVSGLRELTGSGCAQRNFFPQITQYGAELIVFQHT
jgi:hypothetical protein